MRTVTVSAARSHWLLSRSASGRFTGGFGEGRRKERPASIVKTTLDYRAGCRDGLDYRARPPELGSRSRRAFDITICLSLRYVRGRQPASTEQSKETFARLPIKGITQPRQTLSPGHENRSSVSARARFGTWGARGPAFAVGRRPPRRKLSLSLGKTESNANRHRQFGGGPVRQDGRAGRRCHRPGDRAHRAGAQRL